MAYSCPPDTKYTSPLAVAGAATSCAGVRNRARSCPVRASRAYRLRSAEAAYTILSPTAGGERSSPKDSCCQMRCPVAALTA